MAIIHLIEGPVGAGKSTFAMQLSQQRNAPRLNLDDWFATLFSPDRPSTGLMPWYAERKQRCIEQIWKSASEIVATGQDVVLELGLIQRSDRERFYNRVDGTPHSLIVHVLDAPRDLRRWRVQERNRRRSETYAMEVPDAIFELASDLWEAPDDSECRERDIRCVSGAGTGALFADPD